MLSLRLIFYYFTVHSYIEEITILLGNIQLFINYYFFVRRGSLFISLMPRYLVGPGGWSVAASQVSVLVGEFQSFLSNMSGLSKNLLLIYIFILTLFIQPPQLILDLLMTCPGHSISFFNLMSPVSPAFHIVATVSKLDSKMYPEYIRYQTSMF